TIDGSFPDRTLAARRLSRICVAAVSRGGLRGRPICERFAGRMLESSAISIGEDSMLPFALASLLLFAPSQENHKPGEDAEETIAAHKGNLTPVYELEAIYEAVDSAEFKLKLEAFQGDLVIQKVAAAGEVVNKGDLLFCLDKAPIDKQIAAVDND